MIVVIGRGWLNATDEDGNRRLDLPEDYVRTEVEAALKRNIRVIPILVDGTVMPRSDQLPQSIMRLARRNGRDVSNARFNPDCLELISTIERILAERPAGYRYYDEVLEALNRAWDDELTAGAVLSDDPTFAMECNAPGADAVLTLENKYDIAISIIRNARMANDRWYVQWCSAEDDDDSLKWALDEIKEWVEKQKSQS